MQKSKIEIEADQRGIGDFIGNKYSLCRKRKISFIKRRAMTLETKEDKMISLTSQQKVIHKRATRIAADYLKKEYDLIEILDQVEQSRLFRKLDCSSLFQYATQLLGLSESVAYSLITIMRKSREVPEIKNIAISKASRIVSVISAENATEWIQFAGSHSKREIEREIARRFPENVRPEKLKPLTGEISELALPVKAEFLIKLNRVLDLEAQRKSKSGSRVEALEAALDNYLFHRDPVQKAQRAKMRKPKEQKPSELRPGRVPLTATEKHVVFKRDQGRCTYMDEAGKVCGRSRWIEIHHIRPIEHGGSNDLDNLTTLCSFHHKFTHQFATAN